MFPGLSRSQRWDLYDKLGREWRSWRILAYDFHFLNRRIPLTPAREDRIWQEWYDIRDSFLAYEGLDSDHPDIDSIVGDQKYRLQKLNWQRDQEDSAWGAEIARVVALPKKIAPPPRVAPSAEELARRRAQSAAAKRSNGVDYSMSKRQRRNLKEEESKDDDEYACDPKTGYCGAIEPDFCDFCKDLTWNIVSDCEPNKGICHACDPKLCLACNVSTKTTNATIGVRTATADSA